MAPVLADVLVTTGYSLVSLWGYPGLVLIQWRLNVFSVLFFSFILVFQFCGLFWSFLDIPFVEFLDFSKPITEDHYPADDYVK